MAEPRRSRAGQAAAHTRQAVIDLVEQTSGIVLILACGVVFAAAAIGGLSMVGALGTFGWVAYFVVLAVLALSLGPVIAAGVTVRLKGSARHRAELERRLDEQRRKFGLTTTEHQKENAR